MPITGGNVVRAAEMTQTMIEMQLSVLLLQAIGASYLENTEIRPFY